MADAKEFLARGDLAGAISSITLNVKSRPADASARIFLFELLCFAGEYDRAEKHLDTIGHQKEEMLIGTTVYRQLLAAEKARRQIFSGDGLPGFLADPPDYAPLYLESIRLARNDSPEKARILLEKALELVHPMAGKADGYPFDGFEDSDIFIGPFLEVMLGNNYSWIPFEEIKHIELSKPEQLRDLIWAKAKLETNGGNLGDVFLPVLYPFSSDDRDDSVKLGRVTKWIEIGSGLTRGVGQRLFMAGGQEKAILEMTEITFESASKVTAQS
jgi:type VI secretion system protein ImpE